MALLHGKDGSVTLANAYILNADNWSSDIEADEHETTDFADGASGYATYDTGLLRGSVTWEGFCESAQALILPGTSGAAEFSLDGTEGLSGTVVVTKFSTGATVNDMVRYTGTGRFSGTITVES